MAIPKISYINGQEIDFYYKLYDIKEHIKSSTSWTIEASILGGPKVSQKIEKEEKELDKVDKLCAIWDYLKVNDLITTSRPNHIDDAEDYEGSFVYEKILAHKLFFPKPKLTNISGLDHLTVWVAEPEPSNLSEEPWVFTGTFLILIESLYDREEFKTTLSGCSALQALSNILSGLPFYKTNWDEPMGRNNPKHPLEKLEDLGAIYLHKQPIETIYRKRYMTDEQTFMFNDKKFRCNDLLGYPLFIS